MRTMAIKPPAGDPGAYTFSQTLKGDVVVISVSGYFNEKAGSEFSTVVHQHLRENRNRFVVNFLLCSLINSVGVADLLEITLRVTEDFKGRLILCSLKPFMVDLLTLAYVLPAAEAAATPEAALADLANS
jgi:anti-anti-sigma regulatory factor